MTALEKYKSYSDQIEFAKRLISKVGKAFHGGGGGIGEVVHLNLSGFEVYYQESDGAKNYHEADPGLLSAMGEVIKEEFPELAKKAMERMEAHARKLAGDAAREYVVLMEAAGMEIPKGQGARG